LAKAGGVYLKESELILRAIGSMGEIPPELLFCPPRLEAEAERTISSFWSHLAGLTKSYRFCSLAANS